MEEGTGKRNEQRMDRDVEMEGGMEEGTKQYSLYAARVRARARHLKLTRTTISLCAHIL